MCNRYLVARGFFRVEFAYWNHAGTTQISGKKYYPVFFSVTRTIYMTNFIQIGPVASERIQCRQANKQIFPLKISLDDKKYFCVPHNQPVFGAQYSELYMYFVFISFC